ncbi:MAG TPA: large-conductance mechanosensitive channel protein MscL [Cytophagales bacterium]|nr:large-conductance mechanosensitive channel protein MscL [Cytophagales bacterium]
MLQEFKKFITRGNVIDLAVGIMIGAAFNSIVKSLVDDIIMPPIGLILNNVNFSDLMLRIGGTDEAPVTINYGNFIQIVIQFLIIAFVIFLLVKGINAFRKKEEDNPTPAPAPPTGEEKLLMEIRDLLKKQ